MTQPTVGRVVWFWPAPDEQLALPRSGQPLAAHVAAVSEDGSTVNLQVIDANGYANACQDVPFVQPNCLPPAFGGSYAEWMPYQRAQHAKNESAPLGSSDSPASAVMTSPVVETKTYADGVVATGVAPLPDKSPAVDDPSAEADGQEAPPAEDPAKASDPANSGDTSAS